MNLYIRIYWYIPHKVQRDNVRLLKNWEPCGLIPMGLNEKLNILHITVRTSPQLVPPLLIRWVPKNVAPVTNHDTALSVMSSMHPLANLLYHQP